MFATASRRVFQNAASASACSNNFTAFFPVRCMSSIPSTMKVRQIFTWIFRFVWVFYVRDVVSEGFASKHIIMRSYLRQSAIKPSYSIVCESSQVEYMVVAMLFHYNIVPAFSLRCCSGRTVVYEINDGRTLTNGR